VTTRDGRPPLEALARTRRRMARAATTLRRSVATDAHRLVDLDNAIDADLRSRRALPRPIREGR